MSIFVCPRCSTQIDTDFHSEDVYCDGENDPICMDCHEEWFDKEMKHYWALYRGEVIAGLHDPKGEKLRSTIGEK